MILEHVGITVRDLERSITYYGDVLGFRLLRQTTTNAYLYLGEELLELIQAAPGAKGEPTRDAGTMERMLATIGPNHVGFRVDDLDAALAEIERRGGTIVTRPFDFSPEIETVTETESEKLKRAARPIGKSSWRVAVVEDPDGTMLELLER
jgi:catechol 2,3-dioxygenase-like lactoylglutathione lyase family enzyme